ncbi:hypothetical protein EUGRSUZ_H04143 [Eucalyptus grandis]|uniref:Uncharacterized protein n=2 Tax=Eucalyptus grandis TaxID=71139 RepID=A0ACC3JW75_EUCGR|nr:hypothetical protein EUGRSUZ_H04143 [Eucalyptus grandis]
MTKRILDLELAIAIVRGRSDQTPSSLMIGDPLKEIPHCVWLQPRQLQVGLGKEQTTQQYSKDIWLGIRTAVCFYAIC